MATTTLLLCFCTLLCFGCLMNLISAACQPPVLDNPFGVIVVPDQNSYQDWSSITLTCMNGSTSSGPGYSYCTPPNSTWNPDLSTFTCLIAECLPSNVDDDIEVTNSSINGSSYGNQPIDDGTTVYLFCAVPGNFIGGNSAVCSNGTLGDPASQYCAAFCLGPEGDGLEFQPIPVADGIYYEDGGTITFSCKDGYDEIDCSIQNCTSECRDGHWSSQTPTCQNITTTTLPTTTANDMSTMTTPLLITAVNGTSTVSSFPYGTDASTGPSLDITTPMPASMATSVMSVTSDDNTETTVSVDTSTGPSLDTTTAMPASIATSVMSVTSNGNTETTVPALPATSLTTQATLLTTSQDFMTSAATGTAPSIVSTEELTDKTQPSSSEIPTTGSIPTQTDEMTEMTTGVTSSTATISTTETPVTTDIEDTTTPSEATMAAPTTVPKEPTKAPVTTMADQTTSPKEPTEAPEPCNGDCKGEGEVCNEETNLCECHQSYYEDADGECVALKSIEVTATITNVEYSPVYENSSSEEFKQLEEDVCLPIDEAYGKDPTYLDCSVLKFTNGSIVIDYILSFNETSNQTSESIETELSNVLSGNVSLSNGTVYTFSGQVTAQPLNECERELDDCTDTQECKDNGDSGFICRDLDESTMAAPTTVPKEPTEPPEPCGGRCNAETEFCNEESDLCECRDGYSPDEDGVCLKDSDTWKIIVAVTVSTGGALLIAIVALLCWQCRYSQRTSKEEEFEVDHSLAEPMTEMTANNNGTVGEIILPWREQSIKAEDDYTFGTDTGTRVLFPTPDYIEDLGTQVSIPSAKYMASSRNGHASNGAADPFNEIVHTYNNAAYHIDDNDGYF